MADEMIKIEEINNEEVTNENEVVETEVKPEGFTTGEKVAIGVVGTGFVIGTITVGKAVYKHGKSAAKAVGRGFKKGWNKLFGKKNEEVPEEEPEEEKKPKKKASTTKKKAAKKAAEETEK